MNCSAASSSVLGMPREHAEDGHHGRGTAHHRQPQGMHPRGEIARRVHQYRFPRPHRRRDPHLDGSRPDDPQGRHEGLDLDRGLRELERRHRPCLRAEGPRADRQGHVGHARPDGGHAGAEDRPPQGRGEHGMGALAHGGDAARDALPQGRCGEGAGRDRQAREGEARGHPVDPGREPSELDAAKTSRRNSTTTRRAFLAMSCAGWTRASAAPRCRTSTMSA